jgi:N-acetylglutamate synthase/N-acetylornithine aminotransferase
LGTRLAPLLSFLFHEKEQRDEQLKRYFKISNMKKLITKLCTHAEYTRQKVVRSEGGSKTEGVIFLKGANSQRQSCRIGQIRVRSSVVKLALRNS